MQASGDASALVLALAELDKFYDLMEDPEHSSDTHLPLKVKGGRCLGHQMIMLSLTRQLLEAPAVGDPPLWQDTPPQYTPNKQHTQHTITPQR